MPLTKNDLNQIQKLIDQNNQAIFNYIDKNNQKIFDRMEEHHTQVRSDAAQYKDDILTEVVAMRQELTMVEGHRDKIEDLSTKAEGHEERLGNLELSVGIAKA